jgi:hypothetical protein
VSLTAVFLTAVSLTAVSLTAVSLTAVRTAAILAAPGRMALDPCHRPPAEVRVGCRKRTLAG